MSDAENAAAAEIKSVASVLQNGGGSGEPMQIGGGRIKKRARRILMRTVSESAAGGIEHHGIIGKLPPQYRKNSRRSRSGRGRGLPKKEGAGGKGTWGKMGCLDLETDTVLDSRDPNYDSDANLDNLEFEYITPEVTEQDLDRMVHPILLEYFEHGDTGEVIQSLEELNLRRVRPNVVSMAITVAMDRKPSHREMTSVLLSDMYGRVVVDKHIEFAFDLLFESLKDLSLDTPEAPLLVGNFLARAVADDCIPPRFVQQRFLQYERNEEEVDEETRAKALEALRHARTLLQMPHGLVRLDNVWGTGGGMRPVKCLITKMQQLVKEYLCSSDMQEAARCLKELEVPHFHHELVYEAIVIMLEDMRESSMVSLCALFKHFDDTGVVSRNQLHCGFKRVYDDIQDICIDVPAAYSLLERFVGHHCATQGFLSKEIIDNVPSRGRKRFVSEGDGGRFKQL